MRQRGFGGRGAAFLAGVTGLVLACGPCGASAQSFAITYQGELRENGELADGFYDLRTRFFESASGEDPVTGFRCFDDVEVAGGRFTIVIQPESVTFLEHAPRFLELQVRPGAFGTCDDPTGFEILGMRQAVTSAPFALASIHAEIATSSVQLGGLPPEAYARVATANTWAANNTFALASITDATIGSATLTGPMVSSSRIQVGPFSVGTPLAVSSDASNGNTAFFTSLNPQSTILTLSNSAPGGRAWALVNTGADNVLGPGTLVIRDVGAASDRVAITPTGAIGIGTLTPATRFDVVGSAQVTGSLTIGAPQGTAPLVITSTTKVSNLNADLLDGVDAPLFARRDQPNTFGANNSFTGLQVNGDLTVSQNLFTGGIVALQPVNALAPQGTAPLVITSTTKVNNLNADLLDGVDAPLFARRDQPNTFGANNSFTGLQVNGDLTVSQNLLANSVVAQGSVASLAPQGIAPLVIASTTKVNNLNADLLDGVDAPLFARRDQPNTFGPGNTFAGLGVTGNISGSGDLNLIGNLFANAVVAQQTVAALAPQGVAPLQVASNTKVNNLNVDQLDGIDSPLFARRDQPNTFGPGNTFAGLGVTGNISGSGDLNLAGNLFVTAILAQDQIYAIAPQGTAPFVVGSTTKVNNLNADMLDGIVGAGYARIGAVNNFANDNTFINLSVNGALIANGDFTGHTLAANAFTLRTSATRTLTIPAFAFQTDGQIPYFRGPHELRGTSAGTVLLAYAAVQLPHGATIQSISFNALDNAASDLTLVLRESGFSSIPLDTPILLLNTAGTFATFSTYTHSFTAPLPVVDNTTKSYYLSVTIPVPATPADLRLGDVHITYTVTNLQP